DSGPGVPAADRGRIFERFRQGNSSATRPHGGTGLGLAIVKEFVELHDGSVRVGESTLGGALFAVELPLHAPVGTLVKAATASLDVELARAQTIGLGQPAPRSLPAPQSAGAALVLVVDDNADMRAF